MSVEVRTELAGYEYPLEFSEGCTVADVKEKVVEVCGLRAGRFEIRQKGAVGAALSEDTLIREIDVSEGLVVEPCYPPEHLAALSVLHTSGIYGNYKNMLATELLRTPPGMETATLLALIRVCSDEEVLFDGKPLLSVCIERGLVGGVEMLLEGRNVQDVLSLAVEVGGCAVVGLIVEKGGDVDVRDGCGWTAWMRASCCGHDVLAERLKAQSSRGRLRAIWEYTAMLPEEAFRLVCPVAFAAWLWAINLQCVASGSHLAETHDTRALLHGVVFFAGYSLALVLQLAVSMLFLALLVKVAEFAKNST